jgi:hypothetical protein
MLFLAKQNGFHFASILQPVIGVDGKEYAAVELAYAQVDPHRPHMRQEREVFYATVRPLLQSFKAAHEEEGVCVADISDTVFKGHVEPLYADGGHLLPVGNQIVAERVLAELRRCNMVPF